MKKIDALEKLENFFLCNFYPILFFALFGMLHIVDKLYFQDSPLLLRAVIFFAGLFFGSTLGYVGATVLFDHFFPRYCSIMEEPANKKQD
ncbi:MAG: hypothetical protein JW832_10115 [Deltaproteobacteria bacterium]|nr:hypothetical protein [Deltaproteobacteria bacterium]